MKASLSFRGFSCTGPTDRLMDKTTCRSSQPELKKSNLTYFNFLLFYQAVNSFPNKHIKYCHHKTAYTFLYKCRFIINKYNNNLFVL